MVSSPGPRPAQVSAPPPSEPAGSEGGGATDSTRSKLDTAIATVGRYSLIIALLALILGFAIALPHTFFTVSNIRSVITTQAILLMVSLALTIPLRSGEFDLSVGYVVGFTMSLSAVLMVRHGWSLGALFALALLVGIVIGLVNGLLVVKVGISAFIGTLGTGTIVTGLTLAVTNGETIGPVTGGLVDMSTTKLFGFPLVVFYALALAVALWYLYEYTPVGRRLFFIGGAREASRLVGIRVERYKIGAFVASAVICSLVGVLYLGQLGSSSPSIGGSLLLPAFAAAFLGATAIHVGRFNAWGTVVGVYLIATGINGLILLGASAWVEQVFNGAVLVIAVSFAKLFASRRA